MALDRRVRRLTVVVLAAQDIPLARYLRTVETESQIASIQRDAFILAGTSEDTLSGEASADPSVSPQDPDALQNTVDIYQGRTGASVVITDDQGIAVAVSGDEARRGDDYSTVPRSPQRSPEIQARGAGHRRRWERHRLCRRTGVVGCCAVGVVRVTYPASTIDDRVSTKVRGILVVGVISLGAAALAAVLMATTIVRPIRRLQRATEQVAAGDFESRAGVDEGAPEIRGLATSFNSMTEKISTLVERQRAFAGDASHNSAHR